MDRSKNDKDQRKERIAALAAQLQGLPEQEVRERVNRARTQAA